MDGEPVARVEARQLNVLRSFSEALHEDGIRTYEADVVFARQYLMEPRPSRLCPHIRALAPGNRRRPGLSESRSPTR